MISNIESFFTENELIAIASGAGGVSANCLRPDMFEKFARVFSDGHAPDSIERSMLWEAFKNEIADLIFGNSKKYSVLRKRFKAIVSRRVV
jgi:hypothetical protein